MDKIKNMMGGNKSEQPATNTESSSSSGGGWSDKLNAMAGGGRASEKNEDALDKGMYAPPTLQIQQKVLMTKQELISSKRRFWARDLRTTRVLSNRRKMKRSATVGFWYIPRDRSLLTGRCF